MGALTLGFNLFLHEEKGTEKVKWRNADIMYMNKNYLFLLIFSIKKINQYYISS